MKRLLVLLLTLLVSAVQGQSQEVVVPSDRVVNSVGVREEASGDSAIIGRLFKGQQAALLLSVPNWYRIRLSNGIEGFVPKSWTDRIPVAGPGPAFVGGTAFKVHFLDVGTGDSAIIDIGQTEIIIDGGNSPTVLRKYG